MLSPLLSNLPVRGGVNVLALALGLHAVGLGLTTDSRGMGYIDSLIDESDPRFLSFSMFCCDSLLSTSSSCESRSNVVLEFQVHLSP